MVLPSLVLTCSLLPQRLIRWCCVDEKRTCNDIDSLRVGVLIRFDASKIKVALSRDVIDVDLDCCETTPISFAPSSTPVHTTIQATESSRHSPHQPETSLITIKPQPAKTLQCNNRQNGQGRCDSRQVSALESMVTCLSFLTEYREFNEIINMSAKDLKEWLGSEESTGAGWSKDDGSGETIGHDRYINPISAGDMTKRATSTA